MIHIITPCTRPENLDEMRKSVPEECNWVIVLDNTVKTSVSVPMATVLYSPYTGHAGNPNRNYALDTMSFADLDWIYILDDDNIIHPDWYSSVAQYQDTAYDYLNMLAWGQVWRNKSVRLPPTRYPSVGNIDTSCYMVRGRVMRKLRYPNDYVADGMMAEYAVTYGGLLTLNAYLGYYNYLRTPEDRMN